MTTETAASASAASDEHIEIDLRDRRLAALLAWLIPGAGHIYQRRYAKGILFFVCVIGTFLFGMYLGANKVVYASRISDFGTKRGFRAALLCQVGAGAPTMLSLVQAHRVYQEPPRPPLFGGFMAPPRYPGQVVAASWSVPHYSQQLHNTDAFVINQYDEQAAWHKQLHGYFELGTAYTMIAGLLNILVIYDAWAGPLLLMMPANKESRDEDGSSGDQDKPAKG